jgi:hypothetical protein
VGNQDRCVLHVGLDNQDWYVLQVGLGNQDWYVLSGLEEIKQFCMAEDSLSHLPSKVPVSTSVFCA